MAKDVLTWINNFTNRPFKFSFITAITRNFREWIELLQRETRILLKETTQLFEIEFDASFWVFYMFEGVLIVVDLADEMLELANLSLGKSLRIQIRLRKAKLEAHRLKRNWFLDSMKVTLFWPFFLDSSDPFSIFEYFSHL